MVKFVSGLVLAAIVGGVAGAASAEPIKAQLRFQVKPIASDAVWKVTDIKFEKKGECAFISGRPAASWPQRVTLATGQATAPLFNPGFAQPDGSYVPNSSDDGFNTLFYPIEPVAGVVSVVCRGTILANGVDVTADTPGRVAAATAESIGTNGPLTVAPQLDKVLLAKVKSGSNTTTGAIPGLSVATPTVLFKAAFVFDMYKYEADLDPDKSEAVTNHTDLHYVNGGPVDNGFVIPTPGASFAVGKSGSATPLGYTVCKAQTYDAKAPKTYAKQDFSYCLKTVEGHIAEIHLSSNRTKPEEKPFMIVEYTVWK